MIYSSRVIRRIVIVVLFLGFVSRIVIVTWPLARPVLILALIAVALGILVLWLLQRLWAINWLRRERQEWEPREQEWERRKREWERRKRDLMHAHWNIEELWNSWTSVREHYRRTPSGYITRVRGHSRRLTTTIVRTLSDLDEVLDDLDSRSNFSYAKSRQLLSDLSLDFSRAGLRQLLSELEDITIKEEQKRKEQKEEQKRKEQMKRDQWELGWESSPRHIVSKWARTQFSRL